MEEEQRGRQEPSMAESQLSELQNMRVLLEEARLPTRNLAYHRRAKLETRSQEGEARDEARPGALRARASDRGAPS